MWIGKEYGVLILHLAGVFFEIVVVQKSGDRQEGREIPG